MVMSVMLQVFCLQTSTGKRRAYFDLMMVLDEKLRDNKIYDSLSWVGHESQPGLNFLAVNVVEMLHSQPQTSTAGPPNQGLTYSVSRTGLWAPSMSIPNVMAIQSQYGPHISTCTVLVYCVMCIMLWKFNEHKTKISPLRAQTCCRQGPFASAFWELQYKIQTGTKKRMETPL